MFYNLYTIEIIIKYKCTVYDIPKVYNIVYNIIYYKCLSDLEILELYIIFRKKTV